MSPKSLHFYFIFSVLTATGWGAIPPELVKIEKTYQSRKTVHAQFNQIIDVASTKTRKESKGTLVIQLPGKFRWETTEPDPSSLISNGGKIWFYTPPFDAAEKGQVVIRNAKNVTSQFASSLLTGSFSKVPGLKIQKVQPTLFVLTPKKGTAADVSQAQVLIDPKLGVIQRIELRHTSGNQTQISLHEISLGKQTLPGEFEFKIPPQTEVIQSD